MSQNAKQSLPKNSTQPKLFEKSKNSKFGQATKKLLNF